MGGCLLHGPVSARATTRGLDPVKQTTAESAALDEQASTAGAPEGSALVAGE